MMGLRKIVFLLSFLLALPVFGQDEDRANREALIIIQGLGQSRKGFKKQRKFFSGKGYDLFIPDYMDKNSLDNSVANFRAYWKDQELDEYKKVHVFCYLIGGWVINGFINETGKHNIATIVYDRSPIQERAPKTVTKKIPGLTKLAKGKIVEQFSHETYDSLTVSGITTGVIVEGKATGLMKVFEKTAKSYGPFNWTSLKYSPAPNDMMFTYLNHDQMYIKFDVIGEDILHFLKNGKFTEDAQREWYDWDPFKKYKKGKNK